MGLSKIRRLGQILGYTLISEHTIRKTDKIQGEVADLDVVTSLYPMLARLPSAMIDLKKKKKMTRNSASQISNYMTPWKCKTRQRSG